MTSVQVSHLASRPGRQISNRETGQNVFIGGDGAAGAVGEIERRKFTAEEGVSDSYRPCDASGSQRRLSQDHLTLLNGESL